MHTSQKPEKAIPQICAIEAPKPAPPRTVAGSKITPPNNGGSFAPSLGASAKMFFRQNPGSTPGLGAQMPSAANQRGPGYCVEGGGSGFAVGLEADGC